MTRSAAEIRHFIIERVARLTGVPAAEVDVQQPIVRSGLDSVSLVALTADLEDWLGVSFQENPLIEHPTIEALAHFLAKRSGP